MVRRLGRASTQSRLGWEKKRHCSYWESNTDYLIMQPYPSHCREKLLCFVNTITWQLGLALANLMMTKYCPVSHVQPKVHVTSLIGQAGYCSHRRLYVHVCMYVCMCVYIYIYSQPNTSSVNMNRRTVTGGRYKTSEMAVKEKNISGAPGSWTDWLQPPAT